MATKQPSLSDSEEKMLQLAAIINSSEDAILSKDLDGVITSWNPAAEELLGYKAAEILGKQVTVIIPPELHEEENRIIRLVKMGRHIKHYQTTRLDKNNKKIVVLLSISPIRNQAGELMGISSIMHDITDRISAEQKARESDERFAKAFASNPAAIAITTLEDGMFREVNQTWVEIMGYSRREVIGKSARLLPIWSTKESAQRFVEELKKNGVVRNWEQVFFKKSGETFVAQLSAQIMNLRGEQVIISTLIDISRRIELERIKDEFMNVASHELKTPVTSIKAYIQILESIYKNKGDSETVQILSKVDTQIDKLNKLIADLLDVTKIQSGKLTFRTDFYDFNVLVGEIVDEVQKIAPRFNIEAKLGPTEMIFGDRDRTGQVIMNLLINAVKYSPQSDKVIVSTKTQGDKIVLTVQDFGIGIPPEAQTKVFERFYRVEAGTDVTYAGLGLGLYISSEFIRRQGGDIWVKSQVGRGSTFGFYLPLREQTRLSQTH